VALTVKWRRYLFKYASFDYSVVDNQAPNFRAKYTCGMLLAFAFSRHLVNCKRDKMHSVTEIEEKIRRRYHQPKGVEQFGIEPVPPELKTDLARRSA
jgi:hypothetical protein